MIVVKMNHPYKLCKPNYIIFKYYEKIIELPSTTPSALTYLIKAGNFFRLVSTLLLLLYLYNIIKYLTTYIRGELLCLISI